VGSDQGDPQEPLIPTRKWVQMPEEKHLRGVSEKEQRRYKHIKQGGQKEGRSRGREKEVAARTVLRRHREKGHTAKAGRRQ
jgi:hypothetical protein